MLVVIEQRKVHACHFRVSMLLRMFCCVPYPKTSP